MRKLCNSFESAKTATTNSAFDGKCNVQWGNVKKTLINIFILHAIRKVYTAMEKLLFGAGPIIC